MGGKIGIRASVRVTSHGAAGLPRVTYEKKNFLGEGFDRLGIIYVWF